MKRGRSRSPPRKPPVGYRVGSEVCRNQGRKPPCPNRLWEKGSNESGYQAAGGFCCVTCRESSGRDHDRACTSKFTTTQGHHVAGDSTGYSTSPGQHVAGDSTAS